MSSCELSVTFDRRDRTYSPGETVKGTVHARVPSSSRCRNLFLEWEWHTHGKGNRDTGDRVRLPLASGPWTAETLCDYPFSFRLPNGPPTYHGDVLNVDWYVRVVADIPWARDQKMEEEFLLVPVSSPDGNGAGGVQARGEVARMPCDLGPKFVAPDPISDDVEPGGVALLFGLTCLGAGLLCLLLSGGKGWWPLAVGALMVLGLYLAYLGFVRQRLGRVQVQVQPEAVARGGVIRCSVRISDARVVLLSRVSAILSAEEIVTSGSGSNSTTHKKTVYERGAALRPEKEVEEAVTFEASLAVPATAPTSFASNDNRLIWTLKVRLDWASTHLGPSWSKSYRVAVYP